MRAARTGASSAFAWGTIFSAIPTTPPFPCAMQWPPRPASQVELARWSWIPAAIRGSSTPKARRRQQPGRIQKPRSIKKPNPSSPCFRSCTCGLEGLHSFRNGWLKNIEFLIVSDAAGRSKPEKYQWGPKALMRLATGIMMDQIRSLRSRAIVERLTMHDDKGVFLQNGNTCSYVLKRANLEEEIPRICPGCLSEKEATLAAEMPTTIRKLTPEEFERLFRHGFEVADYTLYAYHADQFPYIGYGKSFHL